MPVDGASDDDDEVEVFDDADAEQGEPRALGLAGASLSKISTGLTAGILTGLTGQLQQLVASQAVFPAGAFSDSISNLTKTLGQVGRSAQFADVAGNSPAIAAFAGTLARDLRVFDQVSVGSMLAQQEHALTAAWSKNVLGLGALTSWRGSLAIESSLTPLLQSIVDLQQYPSLLANDLLRVTAAQVKLTDWVVSRDAGNGLLGPISGKPLSLWQNYAELAPVEPDVQWLRTSLSASNAGLGLLGADVLDSDLDDADLAQATAQVELDVLVASEPGRLRAARDLYARLGTIDPTVPDLLEAAWEDIERNGPAAASKAAHCIVEVLDRTLRAAAPEAAVREWHTRTRRSADEFGDKGQVTRPLRVRYLASEIGGTQKLAVVQYESLTTLLSPLHGRLEGVKHASTADVVQVRSLLLTAEGFLAVLFLSTMP